MAWAELLRPQQTLMEVINDIAVSVAKGVIWLAESFVDFLYPIFDDEEIGSEFFLIILVGIAWAAVCAGF